MTPRGPDLTQNPPVYYIKALEFEKFRKFREIPGFPSVSGGKFGFWPPRWTQKWPKQAKLAQKQAETVGKCLEVFRPPIVSHGRCPG